MRVTKILNFWWFNRSQWYAMVMFNCCSWINAKFQNMKTLLNQHVVGKLCQILLNKRIMCFKEMAIIQIKWISINLKETDVIIARYAGSLLRQLPFNYSLHITFWRQQTSIKLINNDIVNQKKKSDPPNNKQNIRKPPTKRYYCYTENAWKTLERKLQAE